MKVYTEKDQGKWGHNWFFLPNRDFKKITGHITPLPQIRDELHVKMTSSNHKNGTMR